MSVADAFLARGGDVDRLQRDRHLNKLLAWIYRKVPPILGKIPLRLAADQVDGCAINKSNPKSTCAISRETRRSSITLSASRDALKRPGAAALRARIL
jgi:hypothetical protein